MTDSALPLAGLRVLDISSFIAAPAAAVVLGDWGAEVIKVEGPDGDPNRSIMHDSSNYPKAEVNLSLADGLAQQAPDRARPQEARARAARSTG